MKKKHMLSVIMLVISFLMFWEAPNTLASNEKVITFDSIKNVPTNKEFIIKFSHKISKKAVRDKNIYILDSKNNKVNGIEVFLTEDSKTIKVLPPLEGYKPKQSYTLIINNQLYSTSKTMINGSTKQVFTTGTHTDNSSDFVIREDSLNEIVYTENTTVLPNTSLNNLISGDYLGDVFKFSNPSEQLLAIAAKQIIIFPPTTEHPNGWAKKVETTSMTDEGKTLILKTSEPTIEEVIADIDISTTLELTGEDFEINPQILKDTVSTSTLDDGTIRYTLANDNAEESKVEFKADKNLKLSFENVSVYDDEENNKITLKGELEVENPKVHLDNKRLQLNRLEFTSSITSTITSEMELKNFERDAKVKIGSLPIKAYGVVGANITFYAVVKADGSIVLEPEVTNYLNINVGIKKHNKQWETINNTRFNVDYDLIKLKGEATVSPGLRTDLDAKVLQFTLGGIELSGYYDMTLKGEISSNKFCVDLSNGLSIEGLARIGDSDADIASYEFPEWTKDLSTISNCKIKSLLVTPLALQLGEDKELTVKGVDAGSRIQEFTFPSDSITFKSQNPKIIDVNMFGKVFTKADAQVGDSTFIEVTYTGNYNEEITKKVKVTITNENDADGTTLLKGIVVESANENRLSNATIEVSKLDGSIITVLQTDATGSYEISLPTDIYRLKVSKPGFKPIYTNVEVHSENSNYVQTMKPIKLPPINALEMGSISGTIIDAVTGENVENATLYFRPGINIKDGDSVYATNTEVDGSYKVSLEPGPYTVELYKEGYLTGYFIVNSINDKEVTNQNFTISKLLHLDKLRVVLTWGSQPRDLDLHVWGPSNKDSIFHVYYSTIHKSTYTDFAGGNLDRDDRSSYGPETFTLNEIRDGIYTFGIHDYTNKNKMNSVALSNSNAQVDIYYGDSAMPFRTFNVPLDHKGNYWEVFKLVGGTNEIIPINEMSQSLTKLSEVKEDLPEKDL